MYQITMNDGTQYSVNWCGVFSGILNIQLITDETLLQVASKFSDTSATETIEFHYGEMTTEHTGFTILNMVQDQRWQSGGVMVQLRKGESNG